VNGVGNRPRVVLIGPMGAGKTTVGRLLAERWGVPFRDTDDDVERAEGRSISDIFVDSGEAHFRALEREAVAHALGEHVGVLAVGGGAVMTPETRSLLAGHAVVFLRVGLSDAAARVGLGVSRPLLLGNVRGTLKTLLDERAPVYEAVSGASVDTDGRTPDEVADLVEAALDGPATAPAVIRVATSAAYDVVVGHALLDRLPALVGSGVQRVALVHPEDLSAPAKDVAAVLAAAYDVLELEIPPGEQAKTAAVAARCWDVLGEAGFTRSDAVVAVGGGATTDLGGFVAATWLRGVRVVHVPTTLLGMVDAAVGGKTGINTAAGKNLVGAFHEPAGVLCDLDLLSTLPEAEIRSGLAEVVKCGFIADPEILRLVEQHGVPAPDSPVLRELVERAVRVKAEVVAEDLRERGGDPSHPGREVLNYGHTMGHAVEQASDYAVRHGEAVAIGCVYVAELARAAGILADDVAERHRTVLARVGLPTGWSGASYDDLRARMALDKKSRGSVLRFVVLEGLARPRILAGPREEHLRAAYDALVGGAG
jgi:shikimate kinase / 3-dehydroquinate synthase